MMEDISQDERVTQYLTYCNIFSSQKLFQDYQGFLEKLVIHLGEDWRIESNILWDGQENGEGYPHIFNIFLSVFLEGRLGREYSGEGGINSDEIIEQRKSIERFNSIKMSESSGNGAGKPNSKIGESLTFQTLSVGFFVTAAELWSTIFMEGRKVNKEKSGELKPFATSTEYEPSETIKRLRKLSNNISNNIQSRLENSQFVSHSESRFSRGVSSTRIASKQKQSTKNVSWKTLKPTLQQIPATLLDKVRSEIQRKQSFSKWQILSNFMVNILQVQERDKEEGKTVRVIRVNREFYHQATIIWLLINNKKNYLMKYSEYQNFVQEIMKGKWKVEYLPVLKLLFEILAKEWAQITKQLSINLNEDYQVMKIFIERVRKAVSNAWNSVLNQVSMELLQI